MKIIIYFISLLFFCTSLPVSLNAQTIPGDKLYLGQTPPGSTPIVFAPGFISLNDRRETKVVFSPAGNECMIGIGAAGTFKILYLKYESGQWSEPKVPGFITNNRAQEPFFSPDGKKIFFTSNADIYVCNKESQTWSTPVKLNSPVNSNAEEYHPTVTANGTLYFCSMCDNPGGDIFRSQCENGIYKSVEKPDKQIPSKFSAYDPFIAPDESYIIFTSVSPKGYGKEDQYISYNINGHWTNPKNLGSRINTPEIEYGSYITPDNKYYFFSRPAGWGPAVPADIYWVSASFIDSLKHTNFSPYIKSFAPSYTSAQGRELKYQISDSTFFDDDGNNTLTYSASLSNGDPLPVWLSFNSTTRTFSGTPATVLKINIKVSVTDSANASESCTFALDVIGAGSTMKTEDQTNESSKNKPAPINPAAGGLQ